MPTNNATGFLLQRMEVPVTDAAFASYFPFTLNVITRKDDFERFIEQNSCQKNDTYTVPLRAGTEQGARLRFARANALLMEFAEKYMQCRSSMLETVKSMVDPTLDLESESHDAYGSEKTRIVSGILSIWMANASISRRNRTEFTFKEPKDEERIFVSVVGNREYFGSINIWIAKRTTNNRATEERYTGYTPNWKKQNKDQHKDPPTWRVFLQEFCLLNWNVEASRKIFMDTIVRDLNRLSAPSKLIQFLRELTGVVHTQDYVDVEARLVTQRLPMYTLFKIDVTAWDQDRVKDQEILTYFVHTTHVHPKQIFPLHRFPPHPGGQFINEYLAEFIHNGRTDLVSAVKFHVRIDDSQEHEDSCDFVEHVLSFFFGGGGSRYAQEVMLDTYRPVIEMWLAKFENQNEKRTTFIEALVSCLAPETRAEYQDRLRLQMQQEKQGEHNGSIILISGAKGLDTEKLRKILARKTEKRVVRKEIAKQAEPASVKTAIKHRFGPKELEAAEALKAQRAPVVKIDGDDQRTANNIQLFHDAILRDLRTSSPFVQRVYSAICDAGAVPLALNSSVGGGLQYSILESIVELESALKSGEKPMDARLSLEMLLQGICNAPQKRDWIRLLGNSFRDCDAIVASMYVPTFEQNLHTTELHVSISPTRMDLSDDELSNIPAECQQEGEEPVDWQDFLL